MSETRQDEAERKHALGILLVHGIGAQQQGDTLQRDGEQLLAWLRRWLSHDRPSDWQSDPVKVLATELKPSNSPAFAVLSFDETENEHGAESTWLVAEAWWASTFSSPVFRLVAAWAALVTPWTMMMQLVRLVGLSIRRYRRNFTNWWRIAFAILGCLASVPIAITVGALMFGLQIIGLLPISALRSRVVQIQGKLSGSIGNSYLLVSSPFRFAAMATKVSDDLDWLARQCDNVIVVAHSQGAMVAHEALRVSSPPQLRHFITYGSAITRLQLLSFFTGPGRSLLWTGLLGTVGLVIFGLGFGCQLLGCQGVSPLPDFIEFYGLLVFSISLLLAYLFGHAETDARKFHLSGLGESFHWSDFCSSADPVPVGPLFDTGDPSWLSSYQLNNRASLFSDHSRYWENAEQFVSRVAGVAAEASGTTLANADELILLQNARRRRSWRVKWLVAGRSVAAAAAILSLIALSQDLRKLGKDTLILVEKAFGFLPERLFSNPEEGPNSFEVSFVAVGVLTIIGLASLTFFLLLRLWNAWDRSDIRHMFKREKFGAGGTPFAVYSFSTVLIMIVAVSIAIVGDYSSLTNTVSLLWTKQDVIIEAALSAFLMALFLYPPFRWLLRLPRDGDGDEFAGAKRVLTSTAISAVILTWYAHHNPRWWSSSALPSDLVIALLIGCGATLLVLGYIRVFGKKLAGRITTASQRQRPQQQESTPWPQGSLLAIGTLVLGSLTFLVAVTPLLYDFSLVPIAVPLVATASGAKATEVAGNRWLVRVAIIGICLSWGGCAAMPIRAFT